ARVQIAVECRHRSRQDHRLHAGRQSGDRVPAHLHGLQARSRPGEGIDSRAEEMIREIDVSTLRDAVERLLVECNYNIPPEVLQALRDAALREASPLGQRTLEQLIRNYEVASAERVPVCQDSGLAVVMLEVGQDVHWTGG